jgi:arabinogalactan oligomer/maltooligosaccharide transport system permease protein
MKFKRTYRTLMILPYAMPAFAMLLVWRDMFNTDFGLLNRLFGTHIDWLGSPSGARLGLIPGQPLARIPLYVPAHDRCAAGDPA